MKNVNIYHVIGLMSGTSLDGVDLAYCIFKFDEKWSFECLASETFAYSQELLNQLKNATHLSGEELSFLDLKLGLWYGGLINQFIEKNNLKVDFIASHGHTVFHQPDKNFTLQIGDGRAIQVATNIPVVNNFRSKDVALGGQGAPLVPIGDKLLFSDYNYCINLGGIANVSFEENNKRVAFDIAAAGMVLNRLANKLNLPYDEFGAIAKTGIVNEDLLEELNKWTYYKQKAPKSLGYEQVSKEIFPLIDNCDETATNLLATYTEHLSVQIVNAINTDISANVLVTGGGALNSFLIQSIKEKLPNQIDLAIPENKIIEFKEAIIFALLGVLKSRGEINCLSSVTGASEDSIGGVVYE